MPPFLYPDLVNAMIVGATLFALGMIGFLTRRNLIVMFLSVELMLQGVALTFVGFGRYHGNWNGQVFTILILTVAACEAGLALALILILFSRRQSLDVSLWTELREADAPLPPDDPELAEPIEQIPGPETYPKLPRAGVKPALSGPVWEQRRD
ncbi:NADH-ubiquinone oxidoreductase chain 4L [Isosphaera pallida ATCC 43644]|uniref:NADH-quinone oxidoreductase subunit K n=1 Tax=Isosphaera pallida (strain ATCC 43644 / DSM 9630 / IS1B) TaxID=575540 RepID=E8QZ70_ISOPI|nr:NADH-quinone oxidoreductase subunit NuoK [Isosphaera pallida]ADV64199.1 NADH-ubiquinone oxidoreductase chain 4L [Isosphaera pallida ATCC 43644]